MQTLKYKTMLSIGSFVVLLSGCTFEDDQATLLSHIIGNYELLYECDNGTCNDYNEPSDSKNLTKAFSGYMVTMTPLSSRASSASDELLDIKITNSEEVISCFSECDWHIDAVGSTYVMEVKHVKVCDTTKSGCEDNADFHPHGDKGAGTHEHVLKLVFFNVIDVDKRPPLMNEDYPRRIVAYSVSHRREAQEPNLVHRRSHGGGIES